MTLDESQPQPAERASGDLVKKENLIERVWVGPEILHS